MPKLFTNHNGDGSFLFRCPGCGDFHKITSNWKFNGDIERPTFSPSLLVRCGHYADRSHPCWCDHNAERVSRGEAPVEFSCYRCHSYIVDGKIQFLEDCSHSLAGQTVEMFEVLEKPYANW